MPCNPLSKQVAQIERDIYGLVRLNIPLSNPLMKELNIIKSNLLKSVGLKPPRKISAILKLIGLSPGTLTLWYDNEGGWLTEARETPASPPIYRYVNDEMAVKIEARDISHDEFMAFLTPEEVPIA